MPARHDNASIADVHEFVYHMSRYEYNVVDAVAAFVLIVPPFMCMLIKLNGKKVIQTNFVRLRI